MAPRLTREEFHRWAERQTGRYERVAGEPVAVSPERVQHVRIKNRVWAALDRSVREAGLDCEALGDGVTIEVDTDTDYEPDAVVNCGPRLPPDAIAATNPVIVVEVLSPSTESVDSGEKLADYFRVPSIQHYLIVRARRREIVHHRRSGDEIISRAVNVGVVRLDPPGLAKATGGRSLILAQHSAVDKKPPTRPPQSQARGASYPQLPTDSIELGECINDSEIGIDRHPRLKYTR